MTMTRLDRARTMAAARYSHATLLYRLARLMPSGSPRRAAVVAAADTARRTGDEWTAEARRLSRRGPCLAPGACDNLARPGEPLCAEHDDPPPATATAPSDPLTPGGVFGDR